MQPLPTGQRGLLLVAGETIFPGYLHYDGPSPFHEHAGKRWYITGDLASVDGDGFIHFAGRLKRFLKAGGEMISLPALEEPLASAWPPGDKGPQVAVEGIETPDGRKIVLFTTTDIKLADANALLTQAGFRGIMRLDEVRMLDALPVLGTGKTDYKVLRAPNFLNVAAVYDRRCLSSFFFVPKLHLGTQLSAQFHCASSKLDGISDAVSHPVKPVKNLFKIPLIP